MRTFVNGSHPQQVLSERPALGMNATMQAGPLASDLPSVLEAEAQLLGCCLIDADAPDSTIAKAKSAGITSADFYEPVNGLIFREIVRLQNESPPVTDGMLLGHLARFALARATLAAQGAPARHENR